MLQILTLLERPEIRIHHFDEFIVYILPYEFVEHAHLFVLPLDRFGELYRVVNQFRLQAGTNEGFEGDVVDDRGCEQNAESDCHKAEYHLCAQAESHFSSTFRTYPAPLKVWMRGRPDPTSSFFRK